jgi:hypothetical protein
MTNKSIRLTREMIRKLMATEPLSTHALFKVAGADVNKVLSGIHAISRTPIQWKKFARTEEPHSSTFHNMPTTRENVVSLPFKVQAAMNRNHYESQKSTTKFRPSYALRNKLRKKTKKTGTD